MQYPTQCERHSSSGFALLALYLVSPEPSVVKMGSSSTMLSTCASTYASSSDRSKTCRRALRQYSIWLFMHLIKACINSEKPDLAVRHQACSCRSGAGWCATTACWSGWWLLCGGADAVLLLWSGACCRVRCGAHLLGRRVVPHELLQLRVDSPAELLPDKVTKGALIAGLVLRDRVRGSSRSATVHRCQQDRGTRSVRCPGVAEHAVRPLANSTWVERRSSHAAGCCQVWDPPEASGTPGTAAPAGRRPPGSKLQGDKQPRSGRVHCV
jgi:hypothetical protein